MSIAVEVVEVSAELFPFFLQSIFVWNKFVNELQPVFIGDTNKYRLGETLIHAETTEDRILATYQTEGFKVVEARPEDIINMNDPQIVFNKNGDRFEVYLCTNKPYGVYCPNVSILKTVHNFNVETLVKKTHTNGLKQSLYRICSILEDNNIPYCLAYGTLLGYVRGGKFIEHDDDIDLYIEMSHFERVIELISNNDISMNLFGFSPYLTGVIVDDNLVDLFFYIETPDMIIDVVNISGTTHSKRAHLHIPKKYMLPLKKGVFEGREVTIPNDPEAMVKYIYGERYMIPTKRGQYRLKIESNKPVITYNDSHWEEYYRKEQIEEPSTFCRFTLDELKKTHKLEECSLLDVGCGSGRDTFEFAKHMKHVVGVDGSETVIESNKDKGNFVCLDCTELHTIDEKWDVIYARFFVHSITRATAFKLFEYCSKSLKPDGRLFIECRSVNDSIFGLGEKITTNEFVHGHYRRFIDMEELVGDLKRYNMEIDYSIESKGLSVFNGEDPTLIRIIASKNHV